MKASIKIIKTMESEIKSLETLLKTLENREKNYQVDLSQEKAEIKASIDYYKWAIKEAA